LKIFHVKTPKICQFKFAKRPRQSRIWREADGVDLVFGEKTHAHPKRYPQLGSEPPCTASHAVTEGFVTRCAAGLFVGGQRHPLPKMCRPAVVPCPSSALHTPTKFLKTNCVFLMNCATGVGEFTKVPRLYHTFKLIASVLEIIFLEALRDLTPATHPIHQPQRPAIPQTCNR